MGLSENSKSLMSSLAIGVLKASVELGLSIEDLKESGLDEVVDMCVSGLSSTLSLGSGGDGDTRLSLLISLLEGYSEFVISDMSEDQYPVSGGNTFLYLGPPHFPSHPLRLLLYLYSHAIISTVIYHSDSWFLSLDLFLRTV